MTLFYIVLATAAGGVLSVLIAASLTLAVLGRVVKSLVSLSAGVLLGTALLNVLPEAFESQVEPHKLFATLPRLRELYDFRNRFKEIFDSHCSRRTAKAKVRDLETGPISLGAGMHPRRAH